MDRMSKNKYGTSIRSNFKTPQASVADPDPPDSNNFPGPGYVSKVGLNPDPYQMIRIQIQQKSLKTQNKSQLRRKI